VDRIQNSAVAVPYEDELEDSLSISKLEILVSSHDSMKRSVAIALDVHRARREADLTRTYVPSIVKVLKMMERSISERSTKNGETLRR
jgi:hypothetical protein